MIELAVFVVLVAIAGVRISRWLWLRFAPASELNLLERFASDALGFTSCWLLVTWIVALPRWMTSWSLLLVAAIAAAASALLPQPPRKPLPALNATVLIALVPLLAWVAFLLWRGYVLPPLAPDTLTYHMPRALLMMRAHGYAHFGLPETRIDQLAPNYELLLSTILALTGADTITEWPSTLFAILFLLQCAAMCQRWWNDTAATVMTTLAIASAPVILLGGAAHKNDLMASFFFVAGLHWIIRWRETDELPSALLGIIAIAASIGTKAHGLALAAALVPFAVRRMRPRQLAGLLAFAIVALMLLGGVHYVDREQPLPLVASGRAPTASPETSTDSRVVPVQWGDFTNILEVPPLLLLAPFSPSIMEVPVPWRGESWMWWRYDVYGSNFGILISLLAISAPFCAWIARDRGNRKERLLITGAALLLFVLVLPAHYEPAGYVSGFPRYTLFLLPVVAGLSVPPLVDAIRKHANQQSTLTVVMIGVAVYFAWWAVACAKNDKWAPFRAIVWSLRNPASRWIPSEDPRAPFYFDSVAGPNEAVDVFGGYDTWIYPAFGRGLQRDVRYVNDISEIRPGTKWIVVERAFNTVWRAPGFTSMGQWKRYLAKGSPSPDDVRLMNALRNDPRFELRYGNLQFVQAVFHRREPTHQ